MRCGKSVRTTALWATGMAVVTLSDISVAHNRFQPYNSFNKANIISQYYDGVSDDLLTGGLGKTGLAAVTPPSVSDPPTAAELRRLAIYNNYRALADMTQAGGYGMFYGPNVTSTGEITDDEGLIAGHEYITYAEPRVNRKNVTLMVQVPDHFDPQHACIVTASSSGSRGAYGAIATAGEWGLKKGCAVAYTDKGTGNGAHSLQDNLVNLITGERVDAETAGADAQFIARLSEGKRAQFNADTPYRYAFKHAHSQRNPERNWGQDVLQSIRFAFYVLNDLYPQQRLKPRNTLVIASSISNGGGASLRAAEQDYRGWIDGIAVSEPNVNPVYRHFAIVQGEGEPFYRHSRSLYDYTTLLNVYQGCANMAANNASAPFNFVAGADRCAALFDKGLLTASMLAEQAQEAQTIINDYGFLTDQNRVQPSHWFVNVPQAIAVTYANAYSRSSVAANLCGYSYAATAADNTPMPLSAAADAILFGTGNGIPPTSGINLVNNNSVGGPLLNRASISMSSGLADLNLDGALCLRALATGRDPVTGKRLKSVLRRLFHNTWRGMSTVRAYGNLHAKPTVIVTGRADAILPPNHTSRAYFGLNQIVEGRRSRVHYYEITNAHHLDAFNAFPGFNDHYVPLHHYYIQALDLLYAHLTEGAALPPSQVVKPIPRSVAADGSVAPLVEMNLPEITLEPEDNQLIRFENKTLYIPD